MAKSKEFTFKSKSNPNKEYTTILYTDGTTSCNCRGWTNKRSDKERQCTHTKQVEAANPVGGAAKPVNGNGSTPKPAASRAGLHDVEPMCAGVLKGKDLEAVWDDDGWIAEEKLDGARYILHLTDGANRMFSRRKSKGDGLRIERTDNVPHLRDLQHYMPGTILDGEIVVGEGCKSNDVTRVMGSHHERAVEVQESIGYVTYKVFDVLEHRGEDLRGKQYRERRAILQEIVVELDSEHIEMPDSAASDKKKFHEGIIKRGGEGVILKDLEGQYMEGSRPTCWAKVKRESTWNVICTGFTQGKNAMADTFGAIQFSMYVKGKLVEVGQCSGMTLKIRREVHADRNKYLGQVFEVTGQEMTEGGRIRHPRFKRWRRLVDPKTCKVEIEAANI